MFLLRSSLFLFVFVVAFVSPFAVLGQDKPKTDPPKQKPKPAAPAFAELLKSSPEEFLKRFDKNSDGFVSKEELPPRLAEAVEGVDRNKDGKLDKEEVGALLAVLRKQFGQPQPDPGQADQVVAKFLERFDGNKDGKISKDEAMGPLLQNFEQLDANKDGFLDRVEMRVFALKFAPGKAAGKPRPDEPRVEIPDFDAFDQNADGRLTAEEVKGAPFAAKFTAMDTNKDGKLDRKEFEGYFRNQPMKK